MTADVAARIEKKADRPGWWVAAARAEAAKRDGEEKSYSQQQLSSAIGRGISTVQRWEADGIDFFSWHGVLAILGLPLDWEPPAPVPPPKKSKPR